VFHRNLLPPSSGRWVTNCSDTSRSHLPLHLWMPSP
jgi:hypothetical protein